MNTMRALILHNPVSPGASADEADVLVQAEAVSKALLKLGYEPVTEAFYPDLDAFKETMHRIDPKFVFNLVESVAGTGRLIYIATAFLDFLNIPYTGAGNEAMFLTSNTWDLHVILIGAAAKSNARP